MIKRIFDVGFSLTGILVFAPVWILIGTLIWLEDRHAVLFRQERLGKNKNIFVIYKFRTMHNGAVTKFGKYLRKTGLDETLQFINVLRGEMSIIGPRPLTNHDVSRLEWTSDRYAIRWMIKPGISGPAQIFGAGSAAVSFEMDVQYIKDNNVFRDFYFLLLSFLVNVFGKGRVRKML
ncbi:MAG: sugar transferase [Flavobacteriales bacterium]